MVEPIFKKGDYIINRIGGNMGIVKGVTKKGYYTFSAYYSSMFKKLMDVKNLNYDMQINYQKFFDLCTDEEKKFLDGVIKKEKDDKKKKDD